MSHVQIFSVIALFSLLGVVVPTYSFADESITINPSSLLPIRDDIYLLIFEVCAGSESISINQINVLSDIDSVILVQYAERDVSILSEECRQFEVQIKSTDPNKISIQSDALGFDIPIDYESIRDSPVSFQNVEVTMGMPTEISVRYVDLSHDSEGLTENDVLQCESYFSDYADLNENHFSAKYLYHPFIADCILLYNDDVWADIGEEDRGKKLSEKLDELILANKESSTLPTPSFQVKSVTETQIPGYTCMLQKDVLQ